MPYNPFVFDNQFIFFNIFSLRIFGHQIDENNPSQISEVAEGDENGDETNGKVSSTWNVFPNLTIH